MSRNFLTPPQPSPMPWGGSKKFTNDLGLLYYINIVSGINLPKLAYSSDLYIQCNESASINYQEDEKKVVLSQGGIVSSNSYFNSFYKLFYTKYTTLSSIYYVLKLEGDFKVSVYREVNGENKREILSEQNFEKSHFSEPVKISPINLLQNEKAGRIDSRLPAYRRQ